MQNKNKITKKTLLKTKLQGVILFLLMSGIFANSYSQTYYSTTVGSTIDLSSNLNWWTNANNTGTHPSISSTGTYIIQYASGQIRWNNSGTVNPNPNLILKKNTTLWMYYYINTANFQLEDSSQLVVSGAISLIPGTTSCIMSPTSTVHYQSFDPAVPPQAGLIFGNLKVNNISNLGDWNWQGHVTNIAGNLTLSDAYGNPNPKTVILTDNQSPSITIGKNFSAQNIIFTKSGNPTITVNGDAGAGGNNWILAQNGGNVTLHINGNMGIAFTTIDLRSAGASPGNSIIEVGKDLGLNTNTGTIKQSNTDPSSNGLIRFFGSDSSTWTYWNDFTNLNYEIPAGKTINAVPYLITLEIASGKSFNVLGTVYFSGNGLRGAGTINVTNGATFVTDNGYFTNFTSIRNFNGANIVMKNGANAYSLNFLPANTTINSLTLGITNGTPSFDSSITINNYIKFQSGTGIYSLNNTLTLGPNFTFIGSDSTYKLLRCTGTGEIRKQFNSPGSFKFEISRGDIYIPVVVNFTGGTFNPGAYVGIKPVYDGSAHPNNTSTTNYLKRYWTLSSSGINNFTANLTFKYRTADVIGPENTLYTSCYSNGKWTQYNKADTTNKYLTAFVGSFGDFTGAGQNMNQLPQTFIRNNLNMNFGANSNIKDTIIYPSSPGMSAQTNFISNVQVKIDTALCTRTGDLDFELIHQGVTDTIIYKVGGSGANFIGTTLNDSTATLLTSGSAPFNGKYKPYKPLSQFNNQSPEGSWILRLNNSGSSSSGILKSWSLRIIYYSSPYSFINITAIPSGFYDAGTGMLTMKDTVKAYIALNTPPYTIIDSAKAVIDSVTFTGQFKFNTAPTGTYYIILKHRNSIDTWSTAGGISFSRGNIMNFDFTTSQAQAFGNNLVQVGTKWCLINGDCNGDGYIDGSDYLEVINHYDESGYLKGDTNGDGYVDGSDYLAIINNYDKGVVMPASPMRKISIRKIR